MQNVIERLVFIKEQKAGRRGQHLLKSGHARAVAMRGRERVVDIEVKQRRKRAHKPGIEHFTGLKLDFLFKAADLLAKIAQVAEQDALPLPQRVDRFACGGAAHVVDIFDLAPGEDGELLRVLFERDQILIIERIALMGDDRHLRAAVEQVAQRRQALFYAIIIDDPFCLRVDGRIDIKAQQHPLACYVHAVQRRHFYFHFPIPK